MLVDEDVWLGATDTAVEGEWRWTAADNSLLTYFNWDGSQPSDGAGENCVEIRGVKVGFVAMEIEAFETDTAKSFDVVRVDGVVVPEVTQIQQIVRL